MQLPETVGVMTLPNTTLFPQALLPLFIFEPRYRRMLDEALDSHRMFCVALRKPESKREEPAEIAGLGLIRASVQNPDGTSNLILQGITRVRLLDRVRLRPYRLHRIHPLPAKASDTVVVDALCTKVIELVGERLKQGFQLPIHLMKQLLQDPPESEPDSADQSLSSYAMKQGMEYLTQLEDPGQLADIVSSTLLSASSERQTILESLILEDRLKHLIRFLMDEIDRNQTPF